MNIQILSEDMEKSFSDGKIVFKIESSESAGDKRKAVGMVNTKDDYERKLQTHNYMPLLFVTKLPLRLAYLYGCLNPVFREHQTCTFYFYWRKIGETVWHDWFEVHPYFDSVYGEKISLLS